MRTNDTFSAIADPGRREILKLLKKKSMTVNSLAENFDISRPAVSKHIKILGEAGFISIKESGRERLCSLDPRGFKALEKWITGYADFWNMKLDDLGSFLEQSKKNKL